MRTLSLLIIVAVILLSCTIYSKNSYYTGDKFQDSLITSVDKKLSVRGKVKVDNRKSKFGKDSIIFYSTNRLNKELILLGFSDMKADRRTVYSLLNGELLKVLYKPNHSKGELSNVYFFEAGKLLYERHRNVDSPNPQSFIDDIDYFKKILHVK